jgi:hypothetical protein
VGVVVQERHRNRNDDAHVVNSLRSVLYSRQRKSFFHSIFFLFFFVVLSLRFTATASL